MATLIQRMRIALRGPDEDWPIDTDHDLGITVGVRVHLDTIIGSLLTVILWAWFLWDAVRTVTA